MISNSLLTERETQIVELIADGLSTKEIGEKLKITSGTVESHRKNIFNKMGAKNVAGMISLAYKTQILKL